MMGMIGAQIIIDCVVWLVLDEIGAQFVIVSSSFSLFFFFFGGGRGRGSYVLFFTGVAREYKNEQHIFNPVME